MTGERRTGPPEELLDSASDQQPRRECDVIMNGGITIGVLYPLAVCELARVYRLRNVCGTSHVAMDDGSPRPAPVLRIAPEGRPSVRSTEEV